MEERKLIIDALIFKWGKAYGYQEYLFNLLDYLLEKREDFKYSSIIIVCDRSQKKYFKKYLAVFDIVTFNVSNKLYQLFIQNVLRWKLNLSKNDVILFTYNYSSLIKQCKHVLVIHDLLYLRKSLFPYYFMRIQRLLYMPRSIKLADAIIAISTETKRDIERHFLCFPEIFVVYNYFNFKKFDVLESLNPFSFKNYFLCVSSSAYHKNMQTVIKAFEKYCEMEENMNLVIVGSLGNEKSGLRKCYNTLNNLAKDRIYILSNLSIGELAYIYRNCYAYISATLFEGLGMPIVEAMYFNIPIILSDIPICREVSLNRGFYFNPYSYKELALLMYDLFINKPFDINKMNNQLVLDTYSQENTSKKYIEILNQI